MDTGITIALISTLGVSIVNAVSGIIVNILGNKAKKQRDEMHELEKKVIKQNEDIIEALNVATKNQDKRYLIRFMDRAERGEAISKEEMKTAFEVKEEYNKLHGNSYVDTKWQKLIDKEILKL